MNADLVIYDYIYTPTFPPEPTEIIRLRSSTYHP